MGRVVWILSIPFNQRCPGTRWQIRESDSDSLQKLLRTHHGEARGVSGKGERLGLGWVIWGGSKPAGCVLYWTLSESKDSSDLPTGRDKRKNRAVIVST